MSRSDTRDPFVKVYGHPQSNDGIWMRESKVKQ